MAAYMVSQKPRKCRASFVANVAKSVASKGRVFWSFLEMSVNLRKNKKSYAHNFENLRVIFKIYGKEE
jgi:hypothetical protein